MRLIDADKLPRQKQLEAMGNGEYTEVEIVRGVDIDNAPTIEAEPVIHGWWKKTTCFQAENMYECSECRWYMYGENVVKAAAYCPNCGSKMDKE